LRIHNTLVKEAGKLRYPKEQRVKMFKTLVEQVRKNDLPVKIALCKESPQIWKAAGLDMKNLSCNCVD
jgi:hypothetical protein